MRIDLDDDDTTPTENAAFLGELAATLRAPPLSVVDWGVTTSPGSRRRMNEDAWGRRDGVFAVADGMGGRGGGALAARTAIDRFVERVAADPAADLRDIVTAVNTDVLAAADVAGIERVGTTLLAAIVGGPVVTVVHVGDCRAYRSSGRRGEPVRFDVLTDDHNVRAELLAAGLEVADYRDRGVALHGLTSFLGLEHDVLRIDVIAVAARAGDRLLLCTDGVHRQLDDDRLRGGVTSPSCRQAAEQLVQWADDAGGRDNATAMVLELGAEAAGR